MASFLGNTLEGLYLPSIKGSLHLKAKAGEQDLLGDRQQHWDSDGSAVCVSWQLGQIQTLAVALQSAIAGGLTKAGESLEGTYAK